MKKRSSILALALTLVLSLGSVQGVFADTTIPGVDENTVDKWATQYANETIQGKYKVVDTETLYKWVSNPNEKMVIVDTMPDWSFDYQIAEKAGKTANGHIPGAINQVVSMKTNGGMTSAEKTDMIKKVNAKLPYKTVTKTTWKKVSKKAYKKLKKANRKTKKVKGKTYYYKKVVTKSKVKDKSYKIVVYCGWVKCDRSHQGAAYLVKQGYTNVYRYGGGIDAWKDAGYEREGLKPADPEPEAPAEPVVKEGTMTVNIDLSTGNYKEEGKVAKVWVPIPQSNELQTIGEDISVVAEKATKNEFTTDSEGNKALYLEWDETVAPEERTAVVKYEVSRKSVVKPEIVENGTIDPAEFADELAPFYTSGDLDKGIVKETADKIVADAKAETVYDKAKAIYEWEIHNLYRLNSQNGCGNGDVPGILERYNKGNKAGGKCTDLNSTFVALCRAAGIPARESFGCRMNENATGGEHCRAEFYVPGTGWVQADPADTLKAMLDHEDEYRASEEKMDSLRDQFWLTNNENWVMLSQGRDITLTPAQTAESTGNNLDDLSNRCLLNADGTLNNFGYIYGEFDGQYMQTYKPAEFGYTMSFATK